MNNSKEQEGNYQADIAAKGAVNIGVSALVTDSVSEIIPSKMTTSKHFPSSIQQMIKLNSIWNVNIKLTLVI